MTRQANAFRLRLSKMKRRYLQSRVIAEQRRRRDFAFIHITKCGGTSLTVALGQAVKLHDTAQERRAKLGAERWDELYTFSVVRHPYERMISYFAFHQKTAYRSSRVGDLALNDWVRAALQGDGEFARITARELRPCRDWLVDEADRIVVTDVFRLEELKCAWPKIQARTGVKSNLPHSNASRIGLSRSDLDKSARAIIQAAYARDFKTFGYKP